jgi:general secretion pathway protein A
VDHLREFGLSRDPFSNDAAEAFYYASPAHRAAEQRLMRGITQHKGLCLLVGETGAGKSVLARRVLENLEEEVFEASLLMILQSDVDAVWLLARVARQLGVEEPAGDPGALLAEIYDRLSVYFEEGRRPVLIIDDAHLLGSRERMEALRALVDLEYEDRQLLTLVLVGERALDAALAADPRLPNRLDLRVTLGALDLSASAAYLGHRLTAAGGHPSVLDPDAVELLHERARGLPRRLNVLADNALFEAHLDNRTQVVTEDVERAAADLLWGRRGEAIDLNDEVPFGESASFGTPGDLESAFAADDDEKEGQDATFFETDSPPTVVIGAAVSDGSMDRDVDDLFDNLIRD